MQEDYTSDIDTNSVIDTNSDSDIDSSWIEDFEKYNDFYKEKITDINLKFIFLNNAGYIDKIKTDNVLLEKPNILPKEQLLLILKQILIENNRQYSLMSMFTFNISLDNDEVEELCYTDSIDFDEYITTINGIDDIYWKDSINLFKDMNELNIILMKKKTTNNNTKKVYLDKRSNHKHKHTRKHTREHTRKHKRQNYN